MTLSRMPAQLIAGDSLSLSIAVGDYPASEGYAAELTLTPIAGGTPTTVAASDGADEWDVTVPSATTGAFTPGLFRYLFAATKSGERSTIDHGQVLVLADPSDTSTDLRSGAQRALDAIDAVLESRASSEDLKYEFADGRSIEKVPHGELLQLRKHYARIVARENNKGRGPKRVQVRL